MFAIEIHPHDTASKETDPTPEGFFDQAEVVETASKREGCLLTKKRARREPDEMANPRQRRKLRSGSSTKPSAKAKKEATKRLVRVPIIKGAKVIQDNWDKKLTVRQK